MANTYNFTRDGIEFAVTPMTQEAKVSWQPSNDSTTWTKVVSEGWPILPMFHAVEINWDSAKLQLPTYIKDKLSFDPIDDDDISYSYDDISYSYDGDESELDDGYVTISKTSQLLNIIEKLANVISVPSEDTTSGLLERIETLENKVAALEGGFVTLANNVGQLVTIVNG